MFAITIFFQESCLHHPLMVSLELLYSLCVPLSCASLRLIGCGRKSGICHRLIHGGFARGMVLHNSVDGDPGDVVPLDIEERSIRWWMQEEPLFV